MNPFLNYIKLKIKIPKCEHYNESKTFHGMEQKGGKICALSLFKYFFGYNILFHFIAKRHEFLVSCWNKLKSREMDSI